MCAVGPNGGAEFGGDDDDRAIPHQSDRSVESFQACIQSGNLAREDLSLIGVGIQLQCGQSLFREAGCVLRLVTRTLWAYFA